MCGACGRTVVPDPVLGGERTLRSQFIVAQTVNSVCNAVPGLPSVQVAGDGWILRTATGTGHSCATVRDIWVMLIMKADTRLSVPLLLDAIEREIPKVEGLVRSVLQAGLDAGEEERQITVE